MKEKEKRILFSGTIMIAAFVLWTVLIQTVDVQPVGQKRTNVGFATLNSWFHKLTGVHMTIYTITDWLGLVPVFVCMLFGGFGLNQLIQRKSMKRVDHDIILLGVYYVIVIAGYLIFEKIPINYRPILIEGRLESSYPSSTTLLVLSVMPTLIFQVSRRVENIIFRKRVNRAAILYSVCMVIGRLVSGVHWFTDIVGAVLLSSGLFCNYIGIVMLCDKDKK
ncbi:MAG: phosphatase PAP2 family protein [Anaerotignum sp.]|nr:phosphatase PAP2 family protein [Anaerotignum sp.]MBQ7084869.1 phosphatase PAP2 family protein [Anaerotignum sp.]